MLYERGILKNSQIKFTDTKFTDKHKKQSFRGTLLKEVLQNILQKTQNYIFTGVSFLKKLQAGILKLSEAPTGDVL